MNLTKLFKTQDKLDDRIIEEKGLQGQDLLDKKILALQVELGELANEHKGFKFWSTNQEPRDSVFSNCDDEEAEYFFCGECHREFSIEDAENWDYECNECFNTLMGMKERNPLLEEYIDCLHFILSIGNDLGMTDITYKKVFRTSTVFVFNELFQVVGSLNNIHERNKDFVWVVSEFIKLGEMLGFTWEQIEAAYYEKNEINHARQQNGY